LRKNTSIALHNSLRQPPKKKDGMEEEIEQFCPHTGPHASRLAGCHLQSPTTNRLLTFCGCVPYFPRRFSLEVLNIKFLHLEGKKRSDYTISLC